MARRAIEQTGCQLLSEELKRRKVNLMASAGTMSLEARCDRGDFLASD